MHLMITTKAGTDRRITVTGFEGLGLKHGEEKGFLATLQAYAQNFYHQGLTDLHIV